jgi:membrane protein
MADWLRNLVATLNRWLERRRWTRVVRDATLGFFADDVLHYAGSMAYFAVLSLLNLLILGVVVASVVVGEGTARQFVIDRTVQALPVATSDVATLIDGAVAARGGVTVLALAFLLWSALGVFSAVSGGVTRVFTGGRHRPFWRERLIGVMLLVATGILAAASVAAGLGTQMVEEAVQGRLQFPGLAALFAVIAFLVPLGLVFVAFLVIFRLVPTETVAWVDAVAGATVASVLWTLLRIGFTFFATHIARYDTVFGPIGTAVSLLVFLYFSSVVLLLGAEVVRASATETEGERRTSGGLAPSPRDLRAQTPG